MGEAHAMASAEGALRGFEYASRPIILDDGAEIAYAERGSGQPVLLVPGWTMSCEVFMHQLAGLAPGFHVITFDPRGHGRSSSTIHGNSYPQHGRDLAEIIEALGLVDVNLVGWSCGSLAVYAYLDQFGIDRVRSVTSIDSTPKPLSGADWAWGFGDLDECLDDCVRTIAEPDGFALAFVEKMVQRPLQASDRDWLVDMHVRTERHVAVALEVSAMHCDYRELAARIGSRLPYVNAVRESRIGPARRWLDAHVPDAALWPMSSHLGFWEEPDPFNQRLLRFLHAAR